MAIDSPTKRKSIIAIGAMFIGPIVVPTGTFDQADRQVIGYSYSGIEADAPPAVVVINKVVHGVTPIATIRTVTPITTTRTLTPEK